ncbi:MAG TPA: diaminopropionate ammonia-lyase [Acidimicrobiia bacterium]|nr:diaminopropionate ammonia-lyase [Acidimicrobiia bacterium]
MTEVFVNPARRPWRASVRNDARAFHRRLPGYEVRPVRALPTIAARLGLRDVWIKDESARFGLPAFKILGASWAIYRLLVDRLGREPEWRDIAALRAAFEPLRPLRFVAATDGNHGRAVARVAMLLGFDATILVPHGTAAARIDGIASEGAHVEVIDGTYDDSVAASAARAGDRTLVVSDTSWPGYTTVPESVIEGYETIATEADEQLGRAPDLVVVQSGVGALAAAMVDHYAATSRIVVVEPKSAACGLAAARAGEPVLVPGPHDSVMAGLNCGAVSIVAWPRLRDGVDVFVAIDDDVAIAALRELAGLGIAAGETGASGLAGLLALAVAAPEVVADTSVLLFGTEGVTDPVAYARLVDGA